VPRKQDYDLIVVALVPAAFGLRGSLRAWS
jgi:hypothetical protein